MNDKEMIVSEIRENRAEIKKLYSKQHKFEIQTVEKISKLRLNMLKMIFLILGSSAVGGASAKLIPKILALF